MFSRKEIKFMELLPYIDDRIVCEKQSLCIYKKRLAEYLYMMWFSDKFYPVLDNCEFISHIKIYIRLISYASRHSYIQKLERVVNFYIH